MGALAVCAALAVGACRAEHVIGWNEAASTTCGPALVDGDVRPCTATYVSGTGDEGGAAVDVVADGALVVGTALAGRTLGAAAFATRLGAGDAVVLRLSPSGREVLSATHVGQRIVDLEVEPTTGRIVVLGEPFGVLVLTPDARRIVWQTAVTGARVAVGNDGIVAVLDRGRVTVLDGAGAMTSSFSSRIDAASAGDVAIAGDTIVVTGAVRRGSVVQPILDGHGPDGSVRFAAYGWPEEAVQMRTLQAASHGVAVARGRDGRIYYLGRSNGGNTTHGRDPQNLDVAVAMPGQDPFSQPYNTAVDVTFLGRFAPTGALEAGRFLLPRQPGTAAGKGQRIVPSAIAADEAGRVLVGGRMACCLPSSEVTTFAGQAPEVGDGDTFVTLFSADLRRVLWTPFGRRSTAPVSAVALGGGVAAVTAIAGPASGELFVSSPLQASPPGGGSDVYLAAFAVPE